jgi:hypothetical protein
MTSRQRDFVDKYQSTLDILVYYEQFLQQFNVLIDGIIDQIRKIETNLKSSHEFAEGDTVS